jgi:hypothetical protein
MITLCEKRLYGRSFANLIGRLIFEITGGNPSIAIALLDLMKVAPNYSVSELLRLLKSVVNTDPIADRFVAILKTFPPESLKYLGNLLNQKKFRQPMILPPHVERLQTTGLIHTELVGDSAYVSLRSWFIETLLRIRFAEIGIEAESAGIGLDKFVPHVTSISIEAFKVVNQIENLVRNFVAVQLWQAYLDGDPHPLSLRVIKNAENAYDRALNWKERNRQRNITSVILNPEIAYLSTGDLATLVKEIGVENDWNSWEQIGNQIEDLQGIRNTVMHNQIIDLADLEKLYKLREHIYLALNE